MDLSRVLVKGSGGMAVYLLDFLNQLGLILFYFFQKCGAGRALAGGKQDPATS